MVQSKKKKKRRKRSTIQEDEKKETGPMYFAFLARDKVEYIFGRAQGEKKNIA